MTQRLQHVTPATKDNSPPAVSPTGRPMVPVSWVPAVSAVTGLAGAVAGIAGAVAATVPVAAPVAGPVAAIAGSVFAAGLYVLGMSPGLRRH